MLSHAQGLFDHGHYLTKLDSLSSSFFLAVSSNFGFAVIAAIGRRWSRCVTQDSN